jgi:hypothetical protein
VAGIAVARVNVGRGRASGDRPTLGAISDVNVGRPATMRPLPWTLRRGESASPPAFVDDEQPDVS